MLLQHGKNKETIEKKSRHHGFLSIHFACSNSKTSIEVIRCLIPADSEDSKVITPVYRKGRLGWTPLQRAIVANHNEDFIELLLRSNYSANAPVYDKVNGMLPIHLACLKNCSVKTISLLLEADPENKTFYASV